MPEAESQPLSENKPISDLSDHGGSMTTDSRSFIRLISRVCFQYPWSIFFVNHIFTPDTWSSSDDGNRLTRMATSDIQEFKIDILPQEVERLKRKLNDARLSEREIVPGACTQHVELPSTNLGLSSVL